MDGYSMPLLGDPFPELSVQTTHGPMSIPGDMSGRWFVLFSHPADFTPVCTTEFVAFQQNYDAFNSLNCSLIALSIDQIYCHIKWIEWIKEHLNVEIEFPVIAANDSLAQQLGMIHPGMGTQTVRTVFVIDPQGYVRMHLSYPMEVGRNIPEILRVVEALQTSDQQGAIPADWPHNSLIGDRIIIPPPTDTANASEYKTIPDSYDWWFCHKPRE